MAGGYCLKWTAWRIWRHPKRALMCIEESENVETDLQQRLDEAMLLLEQQRKETSLQSFRVAELSRRLAETEKRLTDEHRVHEETKLKLTKALDSLAEHKSVDEKLEEFNTELKKVEDMKRSYEKRISQLESRLADARKRLGEADDREMADSIDMLEEARQQALRRKHRELKEISPFKAPQQPTQLQNNTASLKATSPKEGVLFQEEPIPASAFTSPISDDKISGKPAEAAKKVSDYLNALQSKRAGRRRDDWLSEPPEL